MVKVETYLRLTDQKYETIDGTDVRKAPRTMLPVVDVDGRVIPDSTAIVDHLESLREGTSSTPLDAGQRAIGQAFKSMLEEHLYFGVLYMRWVTDDGWTVFEPALRDLLGTAGVPSLLRGVIAKKARKQVADRTRWQGIGRMPCADIAATCNRIVDIP